MRATSSSLWKRFGQIVVGAEAKALNLVLDAGEARENQYRCLDFCDPQGPQNLITRHVRQVQVEQNDVVIVQFAQIDTLFTEIRRVDVKILGFKHQFDALSGRAIVFDQ